MNIRKIFAALAIAAALLSIFFFSCATAREDIADSTGTAATRKAAETAEQEETAAAADVTDAAGTQTRRKHAPLKGTGAYQSVAEAEPKPADAGGGAGAEAQITSPETKTAEAHSMAPETTAGAAAVTEPAGQKAQTTTSEKTAAHDKEIAAEHGGSAGTETSESEPEPAQATPEEIPPEETDHVHRWAPVIETVWVVDREARTEEIYENRPLYELIYMYVCNECGYEDEDSYTVNMHIITVHADTGGRGYRQERRQGALIGTESVLTGCVDYPEEGHWVELIAGYICEDCGAQQ